MRICNMTEHTPIYNWYLCPRCKNFSVQVPVVRNPSFFCSGKPMAYTGDPGPAASKCPSFLASGKRGFDTKREDDGRKRKGKQKKQQEGSAQKKKVQHRKSGAQKQDPKAQKTLKALLF